MSAPELAEPQLDAAMMREYLARYDGVPGQISIATFGKLPGATQYRNVPMVDTAAVVAVRLEAELRPPGIYARNTTVFSRTKGRGSIEDSIAYVQFGLDVDWDDPTAHKPPPPAKLPLPESRVMALELLVKAIRTGVLPPCTDLIDSGHGFYPYWRLDSPLIDTIAGDQLAGDLHAAAAGYFGRNGARLDNTADGARVYRLPGTVNRKPDCAPVLCRPAPEATQLREFSRSPWDFAELRAAVPAVTPRRKPNRHPLHDKWWGYRWSEAHPRLEGETGSEQKRRQHADFEAAVRAADEAEREEEQRKEAERQRKEAERQRKQEQRAEAAARRKEEQRAKAAARRAERPAGAQDSTAEGERPASAFDVLSEAVKAGMLPWSAVFPSDWTHVGDEASTSAELWLRPGDPASEYSVRAGLGGEAVVVAWSTACGLPSGPGQQLSVGRAWAHLHHDGDMSAATADLYAAAQGRGATEAARSLPAEVLEAVAATAQPRDQGLAPLLTLPRRDGVTDPARVELPRLPAAFWDARPSLAHIRDAAHARQCAPDAVLGAVLARRAAVEHHRTRVNTGVKRPLSLNQLVVVIGPPGGGKSSSVEVAEELISAGMLGDKFVEQGIGTGEGLIESYVETQKVQVGQKANGDPLYRPEKVQVRHNAHFTVDEIETLWAISGRQASQLLPVLRSAWYGAMLSQRNANRETSRHLPKGSYSLGVVIGAQLTTVTPLFEDKGAGTPQRVLFLSAVPAPDAPRRDARPAFPGPIRCQTGHGLGDGHAGELPVLDAELRDRIEDELYEQTREGVADSLDAHRLTHLGKLAGLLALLDGRRDGVTVEDWSLAETIWATSCAVRSAVLAYHRAVTAQQLDERDERHVELEVRTASARAALDTDHERCGRQLARKVDGGDAEAWPRGKLRADALRSNDRKYFDGALAHAVARGWVVVTDNGHIRRGESSPA